MFSRFNIDFSILSDIWILPLQFHKFWYYIGNFCSSFLIMRILHQVREVAKSCHVMLLIIHATFLMCFKKEKIVLKSAFFAPLWHILKSTQVTLEKGHTECVLAWGSIRRWKIHKNVTFMRLRGSNYFVKISCTISWTLVNSKSRKMSHFLFDFDCRKIKI